MKRLALAALAALSLADAGVAQAAAPAKSECFLSGDWAGWKASDDSKSIYIRVENRRIFRIDFSAACPMLRSPGVFLVTKSRGSPWICHPLDLDLKVSDGHGMSAPCLPAAITRLSPEQASALPRNLRP